MLNPTRQQITNEVLDVLKKIQTMSGRPFVSLTDDSRPLKDLDGFDSLNGVEATVELQSRLGCVFGDSSVFVNPSATRALHLREVVDLIEARFATGRAA